MYQTFIWLALFSTALLSCSSSKNPSATNSSGGPSGKAGSTVVAQIGNEKIYLSELINDWKLGVPPEQKVTVEDLKTFLPMYVDFRLKVLEARNGGYEKKPSIVSELKGYQLQFAVPYWFQKELEEELISELMERGQSQVKVSHVLISLPENASYADTARVYERLMQARELFLSKKNTIDELNDLYSSSQSGRKMGGPLGWIDAGWAVKAFEDVAYSTPVGGVSMPFRTRFGYHILTVEDKRPAQQARKLSHLFMRVRNQNDSLEIRAVLEKATSYYQEMSKGTPWDSVVARYSEDQLSAKTGGSIGWVDYSKGFKPQFIDTVMRLTKVGEIKKPFYSTYGVHIIRLDSLESNKTTAQKRAGWKAKMTQLDRFSDHRKTVFSKIRKIGKEQNFPLVYQQFQISLRPGAPQAVKDAVLPDSMKSKVIYRLHEKSATAAEFLAFLHAKHSDEPLFSNLDKFFEEFKDAITEDEMIKITALRFAEFADLSNRYRNGLVVYEINEDSVWKFAQTDTARLKKLYADRPDDYWHTVRYQFRRYASDSLTTLGKISAYIQSGAVPLDSVHSGMKGLIYEAGELTSLEDEPFNHLVGLKQGELTPVFEFRKRNNMLLLESVKVPEPMRYDEAEFRLISDYQKIRESEWLEKLRRKYSVILRPEKISW